MKLKAKKPVKLTSAAHGFRQACPFSPGDPGEQPRDPRLAAGATVAQRCHSFSRLKRSRCVHEVIVSDKDERITPVVTANRICGI